MKAQEQKAIKIKLEEKYIPILRNRGMNAGVLRQAPFNLVPTSFTSDIEGLKAKVFNRQKQLDMFEAFIEAPFEPINYCIVSAPDDGKAKLLAAVMMQHALINHDSRTALPLWVDLTGGFDNPLIVNRSKPSLLIINNVGVASTAVKMEKLRDILTVYSETPKVIVATGCCPYTFFVKYLNMPIHALCYLTNSSIKKFTDL